MTAIDGIVDPSVPEEFEFVDGGSRFFVELSDESVLGRLAFLEATARKPPRRIAWPSDENVGRMSLLR